MFSATSAPRFSAHPMNRTSFSERVRDGKHAHCRKVNGLRRSPSRSENFTVGQTCRSSVNFSVPRLILHTYNCSTYLEGFSVWGTAIGFQWNLLSIRNPVENEREKPGLYLSFIHNRFQKIYCDLCGAP